MKEIRRRQRVAADCLINAVANIDINEIQYIAFKDRIAAFDFAFLSVRWQMKSYHSPTEMFPLINSFAPQESLYKCCQVSLWISLILYTNQSNQSFNTTWLHHIKKIKIIPSLFLYLSLSLSLLPLLACIYLNNADLVLGALPLFVCLFKINRFMYSPIVSRFG